MRVTVDVHRAHTANTLTAVVIICNRIFVLCNELLVENINHLQERSTLENVLELIGLKMTLCFRSRLSPNANLNINVLIHNA